ncbi:MAG TPA: hypothetical protein VFZ34_26440 [Blastocatellia bacterium]|nr:hypothetical protein [Blastocatellia bacterium]
MCKLAEFLKISKTSNYRHREQLMVELQTGQTVLQPHSDADKNWLPCRHYLEIYQRRARYAQQYMTATEHVVGLTNDCLALCEELVKTPDEPVEIWSFTKQPYFNYAVFVGANSHHILGCILGVDDRLIDDTTRKILWGERLKSVDNGN